MGINEATMVAKKMLADANNDLSSPNSDAPMPMSNANPATMPIKRAVVRGSVRMVSFPCDEYEKGVYIFGERKASIFVAVLQAKFF